MRVLQWRRRGRFVARAADIDVRQGETVAVADDEASRLVSRGFEPVDTDPSDADHALNVDPSGDSDGDGSDGDGDDRLTYSAFADHGYQRREELVQSGEVDHLLDKIEQSDQSKTVQKAVEQRHEERQTTS
jgi:hypothetical protein